MLPGAATGILADTLTFGMLSETLVGGIAMAFTVNNLLRLASVEAKAPPLLK